MTESKVDGLVVVKTGTDICDVDETGVCCELYNLGGRPGYSFIFEKGGYDSSSPCSVEVFLEVTGMVLPSIASYEFRNVTQFRRDYHRGRFAEVFPARAQA